MGQKDLCKFSLNMCCAAYSNIFNLSKLYYLNKCKPSFNHVITDFREVVSLILWWICGKVGEISRPVGSLCFAKFY